MPPKRATHLPRREPASRSSTSGSDDTQPPALCGALSGLPAGGRGAAARGGAARGSAARGRRGAAGRGSVRDPSATVGALRAALRTIARAVASGGVAAAPNGAANDVAAAASGTRAGAARGTGARGRRGRAARAAAGRGVTAGIASHGTPAAHTPDGFLPPLSGMPAKHHDENVTVSMLRDALASMYHAIDAGFCHLADRLPQQ